MRRTFCCIDRSRKAIDPPDSSATSACPLLLAEVAPELTEWASFFAAGAGKRAAAESGSRRAVTEREADDLVRDADRFLALVETSLGLTEHLPFRVA